jgi:hypothetical protein
MGNPADRSGVSVGEGNQLTDYEVKILDNVARTGCHITCVVADPPFAYSAGLSANDDRPEIIILGLSCEVAAAMINVVRDKFDEGVELREGEPVDWLLDGFECVPFRVAPEHLTRDYFNSAIWYQQGQLGRELTNAMQIVWPSSKTGRFPWDPQCEPDVIDAQPALYDTTVQQ